MSEDKSSTRRAADWTFLTNHGHVLLSIVREPEIRLRDLADRVGITERAVQRIVADLEAAHYLVRVRSGRRNHYEVHSDLPLRHPVEFHQDVKALLALVLMPPPPPETPPTPPEPTPEPEARPRPTAARGKRAGKRSDKS